MAMDTAGRTPLHHILSFGGAVVLLPLENYADIDGDNMTLYVDQHWPKASRSETGTTRKCS